MSDIYDESGTVVATHPVQAAQHDVNTNNAQQRINLKGDWYFKPDGSGYWVLIGPAGPLHHWEENDAQAFADTFQPQVSANDEAVAREIFNKCCMPDSRYERGDTVGFEFAIGECAKILARHRHPAAVSADAVKLARRVIYKWIEGHYSESDDASSDIQAYGDACRLDGARKMQEAAAELCNTECLDTADYTEVSDDWKSGSVHASLVCRDGIRALNPSTVI